MATKKGDSEVSVTGGGIRGKAEDSRQAKSTEDSSRAREPMTKQAQEDHIIRLMLAGRWFGGRSSEALAKEWGCHPRTVGDRALVASGVIRRRGQPIEEFIDHKLAELEALQAAAMDEVKWFKVGDELVSRPAQNVPAAINAIRLQAEIKGALVKKHEHKDVPAEKLTDDELWTKLDKLREERMKGAH